MTPDQFRDSFPEFADKVTYAQISMWLVVGTSLVNAQRWGELTDIGIGLVTAHHIAIALRDQKSGGVGAGAISGPVSSKTVDKVSVSYDTGAQQYDGEAFWNMTSYGVQYLGLADLMGAGGFQV